MKLRDRTFQKVFANLFVYNMLFEDSELDEKYLGLDERSAVLGISGAGCRIAGHLSQHPQRIDAVDFNRSHLALTALKCAAARHLPSHSTFYDLFARGWHPQPESVIRSLSPYLPTWAAKYWKDNYKMFSGQFVSRGLTARLMQILRQLAGVDVSWLRRVIALSVPERQAAIDATFRPVFRQPHVKAMLESPLNLLAIGVNYAQWDRILEAEQTDAVDYLLRHLKRVCDTDLERNWFAWFAVAGQFNHDDKDAVPPYLRKDRHERSLEAPTEARFHRANIFDILASAGRGTWSHYTLCDAPDWMPPAVQRKLLDEVLRTSRDGGVFLYRSVEDGSMAERLGMSKHFQLMEEASATASMLERTRQFRRTNYYRIVH